jgi:Cell differentiation family, Rcd1-like
MHSQGSLHTIASGKLEGPKTDSNPCPGAAAHVPLFLYPFLNTTSKTRPFEYLRLTSLGVIGALVKVNTHIRMSPAASAAWAFSRSPAYTIAVHTWNPLPPQRAEL